MTETRTEYAVSYTEQIDGAPTIEGDPVDPTDVRRATNLLIRIKRWQAEAGLPIDAEIVTRKVTTTAWWNGRL